MPRTTPSALRLLAACCWLASVSATAQSFPDPMQAINKCVRGNETFYTNGDCPKGARPLKLNDPMGEPQRAAPTPRNSRPSNDAIRYDSGNAAQSSSFQPLNSFPPLPESMAEHSPSPNSRPELREAPVRASNRPVESTPVADAANDNQAMCGFVHAELSRLSTEAGSADEANKTRIATHQKRLHERATQLNCS